MSETLKFNIDTDASGITQGFQQARQSVDQLNKTLTDNQNALRASQSVVDGMKGKLIGYKEQMNQVKQAMQSSSADTTALRKELQGLQNQYNNTTIAIQKQTQANKGLKTSIADTKGAIKEQAMLAKQQASMPLPKFADSFKSASSLSSGLGSLGSAFGALVNPVTIASTAIIGASAAVAGSVKSWADYEQVLNRVKVFSGDATATLGSVKTVVDELAISSGQFSQMEIAGSMEELVKSGLTFAQAQDVMKASMDGAIASGEQLGTVNGYLVQSLAQFNYPATEAGRVMDVLANSANVTKVGVVEIGDAMAKVGPIASSLGMPIEDAAGAVSALAQAGIDGARGGEQLKIALSNLYTPTGAAKDALVDLGVSGYDAVTGKARPLIDVLQDVKAKTANMTEEQRNNTVALIAGKEGVASFNLLLRECSDDVGGVKGKLVEYTDSMYQAAGITREQAEALSQGLNPAWKSFTTQLQVAFNNMGADIAQALKLTDVLKKLAEAMRQANLANAERQALESAGVVESKRDTTKRFNQSKNTQERKLILVQEDFSKEMVNAKSLVKQGKLKQGRFGFEATEEGKNDKRTQKVLQNYTKAEQKLTIEINKVNKKEQKKRDSDGQTLLSERSQFTQSKIADKQKIKINNEKTKAKQLVEKTDKFTEEQLAKTETKKPVETKKKDDEKTVGGKPLPSSGGSASKKAEAERKKREREAEKADKAQEKEEGTEAKVVSQEALNKAKQEEIKINQDILATQATISDLQSQTFEAETEANKLKREEAEATAELDFKKRASEIEHLKNTGKLTDEQASKKKADLDREVIAYDAKKKAEEITRNIAAERLQKENQIALLTQQIALKEQEKTKAILDQIAPLQAKLDKQKEELAILQAHGATKAQIALKEAEINGTLTEISGKNDTINGQHAIEIENLNTKLGLQQQELGVLGQKEQSLLNINAINAEGQTASVIDPAIKSDAKGITDILKEGATSFGDLLGKAISSGKIEAQDLLNIVGDIVGKLANAFIEKAFSSLSFNRGGQVGFNRGGKVKGYARGGKIGGGRGHIDSLLAMLTRGEFVVSTKGVNKQTLPLLHHLNQTGEVPAPLGFNTGGMVGQTATPVSSPSVGALSAPSVNSPKMINNNNKSSTIVNVSMKVDATDLNSFQRMLSDPSNISMITNAVTGRQQHLTNKVRHRAMWER